MRKKKKKAPRRIDNLGCLATILIAWVVCVAAIYFFLMLLPEERVGLSRSAEEEIRARPPDIFYAVFYVCTFIVVVIIARLYIDYDGSTSFPLPGVKRPSPYAIALVRGGFPEVIKAAVAGLYAKGVVVITGRRMNTRLSLVKENPGLDNGVERSTAEAILREGDPDLLVNDIPLTAEIRILLDNEIEGLRRARLMFEPKDKARAWAVAACFFAPLVLIGAVRLYKLTFVEFVPLDVIFLLIITALSFVFYWLAVSPWMKAMTTQGRRFVVKWAPHYLNDAREVYESVAPDSKRLSVAIAVFGTGILEGWPVYAVLRNALKPKAPLRAIKPLWGTSDWDFTDNYFRP